MKFFQLAKSAARNYVQFTKITTAVGTGIGTIAGVAVGVELAFDPKFRPAKTSVGNICNGVETIGAATLYGAALGAKIGATPLMYPFYKAYEIAQANKNDNTSTNGPGFRIR